MLLWDTVLQNVASIFRRRELVSSTLVSILMYQVLLWTLKCYPIWLFAIGAIVVHKIKICHDAFLIGRKLKIRHFRNGKELPWLASDDNYNFDYQQNRPLLEEVKIFPGDQLTYGNFSIQR